MPDRKGGHDGKKGQYRNEQKGVKQASFYQTGDYEADHPGKGRRVNRVKRSADTAAHKEDTRGRRYGDSPSFQWQAVQSPDTEENKGQGHKALPRNIFRIWSYLCEREAF